MNSYGKGDRRGQKNECSNGKIKRWNGIMSMEKHKEEITWIPRNRDLNVLRKGGRGLEDDHKTK